MNFIKRGITSIIRKPGKTVILLIIIFILGNIICGAISVQQAVENTDNNIRSRSKPVATISTDDEKLDEMYANGETDISIENLSVETIEKVGELPYVATYDYSSFAYLPSWDLKPYSENSEDTDFRYFQCAGGQNPEIIEIRENVINLVSGRTYTQDEINNHSYVAIISQNLADLNNLTVGSKFTLESVIFIEGFEGEYEDVTDEDIVSSQQFEFEVIGIFEQVNEIIKKDSNKYGLDINEELQNTIYTTNNATLSINAYVESSYAQVHDDYEAYEDAVYSPLYVLNDQSDMDRFEEEASALLPEFYIVEFSNDYSEIVANSMDTIQNIARIILYVAIGASLVILSLLITLFLRDRKHEIGIYLSLGERKIKIVSQIVLEVVLVAVISIALSLYSGNILAGTVSQNMVKNEIIAQQESEDGIYSYNTTETRGFGSNISNEDFLDNYNISLNTTTVTLFFAVGIGTVIISTLVPIIYIFRLNPKKILM